MDSLSRLMKDGIGKDYTREDHKKIADQLFSSYSKVQDVRALAKVLGENDLSDMDRLYLKFGDEFEKRFIEQDSDERRTIEQTLDLGLEILGILPKSEWDKFE